MHVLQVGRDSWPHITERWSKFGIRTTCIPAAKVLDVIGDPVWRSSQWADGIALVAVQDDAKQHLTDQFEPAHAVAVAKRLRMLPETVAMPDGRRWNAIPIFLVGRMTGVQFGPGIFQLEGVTEDILYMLPLEPSSDYGAKTLIEVVRRYRQRILSELDQLGFLVTYEAGRYRLGPALRPRSELYGRYYFGPADRRTDRIVTIDRDLLGVQLEIEQFEALINRKDVREQELQIFFEDHPYFLSLLSQPVPHVRLRGPGGKILIPDLVLKPLATVRRDSKWEVLELKLPAAKLLAGKGSRRRLSRDVWKAVSQLREYGEYFADPRNEAQITDVLGHALKRPKLAVLIGRIQDAEVEALEGQQAYLTDVRIVTYDEILQQQRALLA